MKKVIIFNYKLQLCDNNPQNTLQSLQFAERQPKEFFYQFFFSFIVGKTVDNRLFQKSDALRRKRLSTQGKESGVRLNITRQSHRRCSVKRGVLKNFANFTGKHLCWRLFLTMLQSFSPATFLKRDSNPGVLLRSLEHFQNTYSEEPLRTTASVSRFASSALNVRTSFLTLCAECQVTC